MVGNDYREKLIRGGTPLKKAIVSIDISTVGLDNVLAGLDQQTKDFLKDLFIPTNVLRNACRATLASITLGRDRRGRVESVSLDEDHDLNATCLFFGWPRVIAERIYEEQSRTPPNLLKWIRIYFDEQKRITFVNGKIWTLREQIIERRMELPITYDDDCERNYRKPRRRVGGEPTGS